MNKLNTLKLTSITASAALLLSVVFSSSAVAGPGNGPKGPQASIGVTNICAVDASVKEDVVLSVTTTIVDKSSGAAEAEITKFSIQAMEKYRGRVLYPIGDPKPDWPVFVVDPEDGLRKAIVESEFHLCVAGVIPNPELTPNPDGTFPPNPGLDPAAKAANAETTVMIDDGHKVEGWISRCIDDPATEDKNELETLKLARGLCPQNAP